VSLVLSTDITGPAEVNRLLRELNGLDDFLAGASARQAGTPMTPPQTTEQLDDLAKANKLNLLDATDRAKLTKMLTDLLAKAPKLQISFAVEPPPRVVASILAWMRENLDPSVLLQIGLQPNVGAGCVLRTPNREFDLSIREHLLTSEKELTSLIEAAAKRHLYEQPEPPAADKIEVKA